jgi:hypothetical protein
MVPLETVCVPRQGESEFVAKGLCVCTLSSDLFEGNSHTYVYLGVPSGVLDTVLEVAGGCWLCTFTFVPL